MSGPTGSTRRVLVIGAGRRIRNNFLPALAQLPCAEVVGLWSRSPARAAEAAAPWRIRTFRSVEAALPDVDTVVVSVATPAVPEVLRLLDGAAHRLRLVVDTPVFGDPRHLTSIGLLRRFARVLVAEDYAQFPQWRLVRAMAADGAIGPVRRVELTNSGFRYHGLALARSLFGYPFARSLRSRSSGTGRVLTFQFSRGRTATIVEPYDQPIGHTTVVGEHASIQVGADALAGTPAVAGSDPFRLRLTGPPGRPDGVAVGERSMAVPELGRLLDAPVPDPSLFNAFKTCGLLSVLAGLWDADPPTYGYRDALYDHLATAWLRAAPIALDPLAALDRNFVGVLDTVVALGRQRVPSGTPDLSLVS